MEDTQDIRGNEIVQNDKSILNKELSKPVEEDDSSTKPTTHVTLYMRNIG